MGIRSTSKFLIHSSFPLPFRGLHHLHHHHHPKKLTKSLSQRIETVLNETEHHNRRHVMYAGRPPSASVATGLKSAHKKEEHDFLAQAWSVTQDKLKGE